MDKKAEVCYSFYCCLNVSLCITLIMELEIVWDA